MTRPKEIIWFAWIQIALLLFGLMAIISKWDVLMATASADGTFAHSTVRTIVLVGLAVGFAVNLLLLWLVWRRSNVGRWIYIILSGIGVLLGINGLVSGEGSNPLSATMLQHLVGVILIAMLFLPNVRAWFADKPVDDSTFS